MKRKHKPIDEEIKDKIIMLKKSGWSNKQIFDELWISSSAFYKARREDDKFDNDWREVLNKDMTVLCEEKLIERALGQTTWEEIQYVAQYDVDDNFLRWKRSIKKVRKIPPSELALMNYLKAHMGDTYGDSSKIELKHAFAAPTPEEAKTKLYEIVNRVKTRQFSGVEAN